VLKFAVCMYVKWTTAVLESCVFLASIVDKIKYEQQTSRADTELANRGGIGDA